MLVLNLYISDFDIVSDFDIRISSLCAYKAHSTTVERTLQIHLFMQNEPNFRHFSTENKDYARKQTQFKANSNQIKANFRLDIKGANPIKANYKKSLST